MAALRRILDQSEQREAQRVGCSCGSFGDGIDRQHRPDALDADETAAAWAQPV